MKKFLSILSISFFSIIPITSVVACDFKKDDDIRPMNPSDLKSYIDSNGNGIELHWEGNATDTQNNFNVWIEEQIDSWFLDTRNIVVHAQAGVDFTSEGVFEKCDYEAADKGNGYISGWGSTDIKVKPIQSSTLFSSTQIITFHVSVLDQISNGPNSPICSQYMGSINDGFISPNINTVPSKYYGNGVPSLIMGKNDVVTDDESFFKYFKKIFTHNLIGFGVSYDDLFRNATYECKDYIGENDPYKDEPAVYVYDTNKSDQVEVYNQIKIMGPYWDAQSCIIFLSF
ncbi:hypothetical protein [Spiroplasma endosymbiont of Amphibalanus improvisus]|uniref:hypothetical protein n=1 Tax=Spiroplasma endosymbiont of Amphibalanus improvisus TaxID=3066327 RepID=UPI00313D52D3